MYFFKYFLHFKKVNVIIVAEIKGENKMPLHLELTYMTLQERIKERRLALGLTLLDVANLLGVKEATVQRYESGEIKNPKHETILKMAKIFKCSPSYLMGWDDEILPPDAMYISRKKLPLLGEIAAGIPTYAQEEIEYYSPQDDGGADFCLRVHGDSMTGVGIKDGDIVFIKKQETVDDGDIAAVLIDDEATLKRVYQSPDSITLVAENPKYKPMVYTKKQGKIIRILGKAVSFTTKL